MNGVDPAPQDVTLQDRPVRQHRVKVFVYNQQVTDSLTESLPLAGRKQYGIPVVGVYETMPTPATTTSRGCSPRCSALQRAVADRLSTEKPVTADRT